MPRALELVILLTFCLASLRAAVGQEQAAADARQHWAQQADQVQVAAAGAPYPSGVHVWRGRADAQYLPFHRWEIQLHAGADERRDWALRITPLDAHYQPQRLTKPAPWQPLPVTLAGENLAISYQLNCAAVTGYRLELRVDEVIQPWSASNLVQLPLPGDGLSGAQLVVSEVDFQYDKRRRWAGVRFWLGNVGDEAAEEVRCTIHFLDEQNAVLGSQDYFPESKHDSHLPAGYGEEQKVLIKKVAPFHSLRITTAKKEAPLPALNAEGSVDDSATGTGLELSAVRIEQGQLLALLSNTGPDLPGLKLTIALEDTRGTVIAEHHFAIGDCPSGSSHELAQDCPVTHFNGWSFAFQTSESPVIEPSAR